MILRFPEDRRTLLWAFVLFPVVPALVYAWPALALPLAPALVRVDGNRLPELRDLGTRGEAIVDGDVHVECISAASILAKTARDALMRSLDAHYPGFQLAEHKGYATPRHLLALNRQGPSPLHRSSFAPVKETAERS
jgi:ribonuclease HII